MATDDTLDRLVAGNDLDELVREVDRRTGAGDWDGLVRLRDRCRAAVERGFQLWPAASLAEYRLALRAPGGWAGAVVAEGAGRFALGPLTEVAASTHTWADLAPHLAPGPLAGVVAHERVVRGEDLRHAAVPFADVFDLPLALEKWEPVWPVATYDDDEVDARRPPLPRLAPVRLPAPGAVVDEPEGRAALLAVPAVWASQSNGRAAVSTVAGGALAAVAALGMSEARAVELESAEALAQLAWAAASGGAHGRRRGAAAGRHLAWECANALGDVHWFAWDEASPAVGWHLRLAAEDPARGVAWALAATDTD
jgi:resuscitation-promoting factor RpfA